MPDAFDFIFTHLQKLIYPPVNTFNGYRLIAYDGE